MTSKHLKYLALFFASVILGIGLLLWHTFSTGYYSYYAITYDECGHPFITAELQKRTLSLAVRIGSRFPLSLNKQTLDEIDKLPKDNILVHSLDGKDYEVSSFLIPKIKVGDLTLKNIIVKQALNEELSFLGKFLGGEFNLLLDFPHSRIIACDNFSKLQAKKLVSNHWMKVPFEMSCGCLVFLVDTDFGTLKLAINTTSTLSLIHSSLIPPDQDSISSFFSLGRQQFGKVIFQSIDLPEALNGIDGFIGINFLKNHRIYFDYTHKIAYIEPPEKYFERIPITFASRNSPTINVSIEGNDYPLELDLGSYFPFSLSEEVLQSIQQTPYGTAEWSDFRGNRYESRSCTIPEIKIESLKFINETAAQNRDDFHINATMGTFHSQPTGVIGRPILEKYNLFLDFPHSAIYASSDLAPLQQAGLISENILTIPFIRHRDGILLSITTDTGVQRLILDTGTTHTVIRAPHPTLTTQFRLMDCDFGERHIIPIDMPSDYEFDGFLGLDFLREYPCFIDYPNKLVFFELKKD